MPFTEPFSEGMTLKDAQDILRDLLENGHRCPVCTQHAKIYKRKIHGGMARTLISMYRKGKRDWVHLPDVPQKSRDSAGLAYWGLIEEERTVRRDDGGRAGWWRVTLTGEDFIYERTTVETYAHVYDGRKLFTSGDPVGIQDCLGKRFDYTELMVGI